MKGHDMQNQGQGLKHGDLVIGTKLDRKKLKSMVGEVVIVVTDDEIICKRIMNINKNQVVLRSDAKAVEDITKELDSIAEVWAVRGYYSEKIETPSQLEDRMNQLEEMVNRLSK